MKKIIISVILTVCILIGILTGASASVMIVSSTDAYDDSDAMYANLDRAIAALNNQVMHLSQFPTVQPMKGSAGTYKPSEEFF